jgi:hypothetical protein
MKRQRMLSYYLTTGKYMKFIWVVSIPVIRDIKLVCSLFFSLGILYSCSKQFQLNKDLVVNDNL